MLVNYPHGGWEKWSRIYSNSKHCLDIIVTQPLGQYIFWSTEDVGQLHQKHVARPIFPLQLNKNTQIGYRQHLGALSSTGVMSNRPSDVIYMSMPLYHSAALALGMGMALGFGSKTIIRKKFSARNFFKDCALYKVTVRQPRGEHCVNCQVNLLPTDKLGHQREVDAFHYQFKSQTCVTPKINPPYCINTSCLMLTTIILY